jgi:hypothetical protein
LKGKTEKKKNQITKESKIKIKIKIKRMGPQKLKNKVMDSRMRLEIN